MKKLFLTLLTTLTILVAFSQKRKAEDAAQATKQAEAEALKAKARKASMGGVIMVGSGALVTAAGVYLIMDAAYGDMLRDEAPNEDANANKVLWGGLVTAVGVGVCVVGGVCFFNRAKDLRRKARIKLRSTTTMMPQMNSSYTVVNMKAIPQMQLTYTIPL